MFGLGHQNSLVEDGTLCVICTNLATHSCSVCKSKLYCSKLCQKEDWRVHKRLCSSLSKFTVPPHKDARRAISFEVDEPVVKFIWADLETVTDDEDGTSYPNPILERYFGQGSSGHPQPFYHNALRHRRLAEHIDLRFRYEFLTDGSPINQAVAAIAPATVGNVWRGPLIALKHENSYMDTKMMLPNSAPGYGHMDMRDYRSVVDYLTVYGGRNDSSDAESQKEMLEKLFRNMKTQSEKSPPPSAAPKPPSTSAPPKPSPNPTPPKPINGVRINCLGDTKAGRPKFEPVKIPAVRNHAHLTAPALPARLGMQLYVEKLAPPVMFRHDSYQLQNPAVTYLYINDYPDITANSDWGWAPIHWQEMVGSVTVSRADGKDLSVDEVKMLCNYCRHHVPDWIQNAKGHGLDQDNPMSKEEAIKRMTPFAFEMFCVGFKEGRSAPEE